MSASQSATSEKRIRVMRPAGTTLVVKWPALIAVLQSAFRAMGWQLQIDGAESMKTDVNGNVQAKIAPGSGAGTAGTHPFKVAFVSGTTFHVEAGTIEGQLITAQDIDVGSTRPVAILAYPQYTLGIDGGEYVNTIAVKTGASAPVLESSTSILSDVDSGITSAGTEARALIAYIDTGDVISQITTGNITGRFGDDGSLTGVAAGDYNKNT